MFTKEKISLIIGVVLIAISIFVGYKLGYHSKTNWAPKDLKDRFIVIYTQKLNKYKITEVFDGGNGRHYLVVERSGIITIIEVPKEVKEIKKGPLSPGISAMN